ncbi:helix-turn-helix domain-containing protein [Exiguobacterium antarcticum]|uniref:Helix-turn-helix domain-containing protein n=1 Tax=Exiguobacterium antarcticum TaxID=132920 RepID=A0ABT6R2L3_9BACL|nr:helix-turn-helix domain-containing protein [Exiguobacterium antarcticum]MDI3235185.1 helix-turn-helix domain-containing protein [Exiguobacterium antarcticum]
MQPYLRIEHHVLRDGANFSSVHEKMIYFLVQSYAGPDGFAFPSHQTLADAVPCGKTTVKTCLQSLIEKGWIEKVKRFDRHGGQTSNGYRICLPERVVSRQEGGQETAAGQSPVAPKEKGVKKNILKKYSPSSTGQTMDGVVQHFDTEIGRVTPSIRRQLDQLVEESSDAVVHHAIEQATAANIRHFNYIKAIVNKLKEQRLLTPEEIDDHERRRQQRSHRARHKTNRTRLPDWVERERRQQQQVEAKQKQQFEQTVPDQAELAQLLAQLI